MNNELKRLDEIARHYGNEVAALFSSYKIKAPVNGENLANALIVYKEKFADGLAREISKALNPGPKFSGADQIEGFPGMMLLNTALKAKDALKGIKDKRAADRAAAEENKKKKDDEKKIMGMSAPLFGGILVVVLLIVILVIVKASK